MSYPTFPAVVPDSGGYKLKTRSTTFESDLDGTLQAEPLSGTYWTASFTYAELFGRKARIMAAFMASLNGRSGRFWLPVMGYRRAGTGLGSGLVKGAAQLGNTLLTDGWTANQTMLFDYMDYIQIGDRLYMITEPAASDSSGNATLKISPSLEDAPIDNAAIIVDNPACLMMLVDDDQAAWNITNATLYNMSVACREPINP